MEKNQTAQLEAIDKLLSHAEPCDYLATLAEIGFKNENNLGDNTEIKGMIEFFRNLALIENI